MSGLNVIFKVVGIKIVIGILVGIVLDLIFQNAVEENEIQHMCEQQHCHCEQGVVKSSVRHTIQITGFIFVITLVLNGLIAFIGEDTISHFILNKPILGPMICGLIGLIPNCAASVIIAQLYLGNMISAGTMIAGLLVGSGVGLLILFRINPKRKENWKVVSILYGTGVFFGIFLEMIGLTL